MARKEIKIDGKIYVEVDWDTKYHEDSKNKPSIIIRYGLNNHKYFILKSSINICPKCNQIIKQGENNNG